MEGNCDRDWEGVDCGGVIVLGEGSGWSLFFCLFVRVCIVGGKGEASCGPSNIVNGRKRGDGLSGQRQKTGGTGVGSSPK